MQLVIDTICRFVYKGRKVNAEALSFFSAPTRSKPAENYKQTKTNNQQFHKKSRESFNEAINRISELGHMSINVDVKRCQKELLTHKSLRIQAGNISSRNKSILCKNNKNESENKLFPNKEKKLQGTQSEMGFGKNGEQNGLKPEHILDMSAAKKKTFLESFDLVFSDCDGVIWMLAEAIPHTGEALMLLKKSGKSVKFISNNSIRTDEDYMIKLKGIGINDVQVDDVVHPVKPLSTYINQHFAGKPIFSLCSESMNESFRKNGVIVKTMNLKGKTVTSENIAANVVPKDKVAAVVLDVKFDLSYVELAMAEQYLSKDPDCQFLVGACDSVIPIGEHSTIIGSSGFITLLQYASKKEPIILGKPSTLLTEFLVEKYNISHPSRVLFIGDNLQTDIKFGHNSGFKTLLVLSGATTLEQMQELPYEERPDYLANSLADFLKFFDTLK